MDATLWYPATPPGPGTLVGDGGPLFKGSSALTGAPMADGRWPLIVLSQGGLRAAPNMGAWMASRLAADGFVVAMLRQPDPTKVTAEKALAEIWLRPADVSAALVAVLGDAALSRHVDADRVGVLGFQVGGTAALLLAGGQLHAASVQASCDAGAVGLDCAWFRKEGLDLHGVDPRVLGRSHADRHVKAIVAVDPEFSRNFTETSLANISIPVSIINLGAPETLWAALNAKDLSLAVPQARYAAMSDATQYSAFPECKPGGPAVLREDGAEPLCDDPPGGRSRAEIHDALAQMVAAAFRESFSAKP